MTPTLRTARLLLDPYVPEDEESFIALFQDARVSRWMGDGPASVAEDRALFRRIFTKVYPQVHATVAAQNKASLALLHRIGFEHISDIAEDNGSTTRVLTRRLTVTGKRSLATAGDHALVAIKPKGLIGTAVYLPDQRVV
ncbi:MAG: GNAT family N-acetyltransferase [Pseudonocardiaceae bacterium]